MHSGMHRREFVKSTGLGTTGAALWPNLRRLRKTNRREIVNLSWIFRRFTTMEMSLANDSVQIPSSRFGMVTRKT